MTRIVLSSVIVVAVLLGACAIGIPSYADAAVLCANPSGLVSLRTACKSNETVIDPAALGLVGPPGSPGISGWERVVAMTTCDIGGFCNGTASCSTGKRLLGGGAQPTHGGAPPGVQVVINASLAISDDTWFAQALTIPFTPIGFIGPQITILCANVE